MILQHRLHVVTLIGVFLGVMPVRATTYHVDFTSGNDSNSDHLPNSAWKRSPGDPAATDVAGSSILMPGDTVLFKGDVSYQGKITVNASGTSDKPITFKGDAWGSNKAHFEGADPWRPAWTVCPTQESAKENPNFQKIYYTAPPAGFSSFQTGLILHPTPFITRIWADPYADRTSCYSMLNHVSLISRPGEYAHDPVSNLLYVWPRNSDSAVGHEYAV